MQITPEPFKTSDLNRVVITLDDFRDLICGKIVRQNGVAIALCDIGFDYMIEVINSIKNKLGILRNN